MDALSITRPSRASPQAPLRPGEDVSRAIANADLAAGIPSHGAAPASEKVARIGAPLMIRSAADDKRIDAMWPKFGEALRANDVTRERHRSARRFGAGLNGGVPT